MGVIKSWRKSFPSALLPVWWYSNSTLHHHSFTHSMRLAIHSYVLFLLFIQMFSRFFSSLPLILITGILLILFFPLTWKFLLYYHFDSLCFVCVRRLLLHCNEKLMKSETHTYRMNEKEERRVFFYSIKLHRIALNVLLSLLSWLCDAIFCALD